MDVGKKGWRRKERRKGKENKGGCDLKNKGEKIGLKEG
jgi:hypothetical protein